MSRLALVSDIHGNLPALEAVLADIERRGVQRIANLGDILSGPLWPAETAAVLARLDGPHLAGNHERQLLSLPVERMNESDRYARGRLDERARAWLAACPPTHVDEDVVLCHGTPTSDLVYLLETIGPDGVVRAASAAEVTARLGSVQAALVACGHSHVPRLMRSSRGQLLVNPGSVGLQAFVDDHGGRHVVESGSPDARYAIVERTGSGTWKGELIAVPYDHEAAARQAEVNGRPEWAWALRTGYALRD